MNVLNELISEKRRFLLRPKELILYEIAANERRKAEGLKLVYGMKSTKGKRTAMPQRVDETDGS